MGGGLAPDRRPPPAVLAGEPPAPLGPHPRHPAPCRTPAGAQHLLNLLDRAGRPLALTSAGWLSQEAGVVDLALQVADAHQRRGIGTALARHAAAHARSRGAHTLTVHTDDRTASGALGTEVAGAASPRPRHGAPPDRAHRPADRPVPGTRGQIPAPPSHRKAGCWSVPKGPVRRGSRTGV
ncbi:GNAT family N-acetyltransferase [Streptomyces cinnamoneus]|uniref:GNAT family N-acetyltransferase n=1 Tax=Streptomyces cinnamoneus TaxID=53446 RepID=UPI00340AD823